MYIVAELIGFSNYIFQVDIPLYFRFEPLQTVESYSLNSNNVFSINAVTRIYMGEQIYRRLYFTFKLSSLSFNNKKLIEIEEEYFMT